MTLKTSVVQSRFCKLRMLFIAQCTGSLDPLDPTCVKCNKRVSVAEHLHNLSPCLHNLSPCSLHSMIAVSTEAWQAILYLNTPWQYQPRLGKLFYISTLLHSIHQGLASYSITQFEVLSLYFVEVDELLDDHWAWRRENISSPIIRVQCMSHVMRYQCIQKRFMVNNCGISCLVLLLQLEQSKNESPACKNWFQVERYDNSHSVFFLLDWLNLRLSG